jgi:hypothetical protein
MGIDAELLPHAFLIETLRLSAVEGDHATAFDALHQILVGAEDDDLFHIVHPPGRGSGKGVVRLEVDHPPHRHANRPQRSLG